MDVKAKFPEFRSVVPEILRSLEWDGHTDGQPKNIMSLTLSITGVET